MRKSLIATMCIAVMAATGLAACSSGPQSATNEKFITKDPATVVETGVKLPEQRDLEFKLDGSVSKAKIEIADAEIAEQVKGSKNLRIHPKKVGETTIKLTDPNGKEYQIPLEVVEAARRASSPPLSPPRPGAAWPRGVVLATSSDSYSCTFP